MEAAALLAEAAQLLVELHRQLPRVDVAAPTTLVKPFLLVETRVAAVHLRAPRGLSQRAKWISPESSQRGSPVHALGQETAECLSKSDTLSGSLPRAVAPLITSHPVLEVGHEAVKPRKRYKTKAATAAPGPCRPKTED